MASHLDPERLAAHRRRNLVHSVLIVGGIGAIAVLGAALIYGWPGAIGAVILIAAVTLMGPRVPAHVVMRMYRAQPVDPRTGAQLLRIVGELSHRAELPKTPQLYVVPSATLNAFATGSRNKPAIAVTEGLLRKLNVRELIGVLAHEVSHVRNNDLWIMGLADIISRLTQILSYTAVIIAILHVPAMLTGNARIPWLAIFVLYLAPTISSLLQLALSRAREYDADLEATLLTGDPMGLASALAKVETYHGRLVEDLVLTGRRVPQPSVLRSHPTTENRIARLRDLDGSSERPRIVVREEPMVSMIGIGPAMMRPRYRLTGLWY